MKSSAECILAILLIATYTSLSATNTDTSTTQQLNTYPTYDVRNCPIQQQTGTNDAIRRLEVLPGLGFDNLRNIDMGQVHLYNYSTCKVTEDGKYMIPDSVFVVPLQEGHYKFFADYFDHWDNYTSITSSRVNVEAGLFSISGSFSEEKQSVKENQVNFNSKTTRISFRNRVYSVNLDPAAELHPKFKSKIYEISATVQNNDTGLSQYLSELLVRDYGTHFITSVQAGAVFVKLDSIAETYSRNVDKTTVTSAASASFPILQLFGGGFSLGYNRNTTERNIEAYQTSLKRSEIFTVGGASFTPDLNVTRWVNDVPKRLAIIDRTADPIHFAVTPTQFPELPTPTIRAVADSILAATDRYYRLNTRPGCVDPQAQNFDFQANYGDSSYCNTAYSHIDRSFGGLYQVCHRSGREDLCVNRQISQVNPQTGNYNCPAGYTAVSLYNGTESYTGAYTVYYQTCGWFSCDTRSRSVTESSHASYEAFWCVVINNTPVTYRGYLFGGYFTPTSTNMITGTQSCPPYYRIQKIAVDISICVSNDYELGFPHSVSFAGFHSCQIGNPLSVPSTVATFPARDDWPHTCPGGYAQHLIAIETGCEINVCLENGAFRPKSLLPPRPPPFQSKPALMPYATEKLTVIGSDGSIIARNTAGQWEIFSRDSDEATSFYEMLQQTNVTSPTMITSEPGESEPGESEPGESESGESDPELNENSTIPEKVDGETSNPSDINNLSVMTWVSLILSTVAVASVIIIIISLLSCKACSRRGGRRINDSDHCLT